MKWDGNFVRWNNFLWLMKKILFVSKLSSVKITYNPNSKSVRHVVLEISWIQKFVQTERSTLKVSCVKYNWLDNRRMNFICFYYLSRPNESNLTFRTQKVLSWRSLLINILFESSSTSRYEFQSILSPVSSNVNCYINKAVVMDIMNYNPY